MALSMRFELPSPSDLERRARQVALIDTLIEPDFAMRNFDFQPAWGGNGARLFTMRSGEGDHVFVWFGEAGVLLRGRHGEEDEIATAELLAGLPPSFGAIADDEAFDLGGDSFAAWRPKGRRTWSWARDPMQGGLGTLIEVLDSDPNSFARYARAYHDVDLSVPALGAFYEGGKVSGEWLEALGVACEASSAIRLARHLGLPVGRPTSVGRAAPVRATPRPARRATPAPAAGDDPTARLFRGVADGDVRGVERALDDGAPIEALAVGPYAYDRNLIVSFDTTTGERTPFEVVTDGHFGFVSMVHDGTDLMVASSFESAGGASRRCLAAFDAATGLPTAWAPRVGPDDGCAVYALERAGDAFYFGGYFTEVDGTNRAYLAAVDGSGALLPWDPGGSEGVHTLYAADGIVYAGGYFETLGGEFHPWVGAIDGTTGAVQSWDPGADGDVRAFAKDGDTLYVGGQFEEIGGQARSYLAAVSATTGVATSWNPGADADVNDLLLHDGLIYAGGDFVEIGGDERPALAAIEPDGDLAPWDPDASGDVSALAVHGGTLYASGRLHLGALGRTHLGAMSLATGEPTAVAGPAPGVLTAFADGLAVDPAGRVFVGGDFDYLGGAPALGFAAFEP